MIQKNKVHHRFCCRRVDDTLEELFKKLKRFRGRVKLVLIDGYQGYEKFISKYLGIKR